MIDVEGLIASELERILPLPDGGRASWQDVLDRAGQRRRRMPARRRVLALAVAAAAAALIGVTTPVGAAIADGFGGFAAWLAGRPGSPASPAEQQAFQQANERSWSGFARGTELRRLIQTTVDGTTYTLYGFRGGDELCLRLAATGAISATSTHCAPVNALQTAKQPALVVAADEPFGSTNEPPNAQGYVPLAASASFGIVSDGVARVLLHADDGTQEAFVASNAFLYVADHPQLGVRVRGVDAVAGDGATVALPFESAPYGLVDLPQPPAGSPQGPAHVDREISGGTISWIAQLGSRGQPIPRAELDRLAPFFQRSGKPVLARLIQPDPNDSLRVGVVVVSPTGSPTDANATLCQMLFDQSAISAGCGPLDEFFSHRLINPGLSSASGGDQFTTLSGLASDDIASIKVFLASGEAIQVPLEDNAFLARISRAAFPIRIVGYDDQQRVIAIQSLQSDGMTNPAPPQARKSIRERFRVTAADGTTAIVSAGDPAGGYRCWSISYGNGGAQGDGCTPWPLTDKLTKGNRLLFIGPTAAGDDVFLGGQVPDDVASVTVTFPDGTTARATTQGGFVAYAIPAAQLAAGSTTVGLRAYDQRGALLAQRGLSIRK